MDKTLKIFLASLVGVIILIIVVDGMRVKPIVWAPTYHIHHTNPLDLYVFNRQVEDLFPKNTLERTNSSFYQYLNDNGDTIPRNYLIIDYNVYDRLDSITLRTVAQGSTLFISGENIRKTFLDSLGVELSDLNYAGPLNEEDSVCLTLTSSAWKRDSLYLKKSFNTYFFVNFNKDSSLILGESRFQNEEAFPCFVRVKYGKGTVYLHTQPAVFTNYALLKPRSSADYVARMLSYLPKNQPTVWFVRGKASGYGTEEAQTPLSVIFRYPALRIAWLIFLYGLLLYVLFNAKRRQRIVPIIKPLRNTTVEFTQTIGNLYYQEESATNVVDKQIIYFLDKIRNKYYLDTQNLDEEFSKRLHAKSGKDFPLIKEIVYQINKFRKNNYAEQDTLVLLNGLLEKFWEE